MAGTEKFSMHEIKLLNLLRTKRVLQENALGWVVISVVSASLIVAMVITASMAMQDKQDYLLLLPIGIVVGYVGFSFPQITLLTLVALIPMNSFAGFLGVSKLVTLYKILFPIALLSFLLGRITGRFRPLNFQALDYWIIAWIFLDCMLSLFAHDPLEALNFTRRLVSMALLYFVLSRLFIDINWNRRLQKTIVYAAWVSSLFSILMHGAEQSPLELERMTGATDTSPNIFAVSLIPPMLFTIVFIMQKTSMLRMMFYTSIALVMLLAFTLTYSRSAFLVFTIAGATGLWIWRSKLSAKHWLGLGAGAIIALLLIPSDFWDRIATLTQVGSEGFVDYSLWRRENYIKVAANMFLSAPVFGVGPGNFLPLHAVAEYQTEPSLIGIARQPHNAYLQVTTETGLVGLTLFISTLVTALKSAGVFLKVESANFWLASALFLSMTTYTVMGFFSHLLLDKNFWIILAMIRTLPELKQHQS